MTQLFGGTGMQVAVMSAPSANAAATPAHATSRAGEAIALKLQGCMKPACS